MPTVADLIVEGLLRAEVSRLFGVPGGGSNLEVLEATRSRGLPFVLCHQEWAACIMAAVTGELTGHPGAVLSTLATFSNLNHATGYSQKSFNVTAFKGQTVQIFLVGTEDISLQTSFVVDDFTLNVQ